jgi:hypothetical protein
MEHKLARKTRCSLYKFSGALKIEASAAALGGAAGGGKKLSPARRRRRRERYYVGGPRRWKYRERESRPVIAPL